MLFHAEARSGPRQAPPALTPTPRLSPIAVTLQPRVDLRDGSLCAMQIAGRQTAARLADQHGDALDQLLDQALSWAAQAQALGQPTPVAIELSAEQLRDSFATMLGHGASLAVAGKLGRGLEPKLRDWAAPLLRH